MAHSSSVPMIGLLLFLLVLAALAYPEVARQIVDAILRD